jgi:cysteinyl-tRNA synthetase
MNRSFCKTTKKSEKMKFFNKKTNKKEEFIPLNDHMVTMYSCGSTVYDVAHVGNLSSFIFADLIRRWLEYRGYQVKHIVNITDVEDKIIKRSSGTLPGLKEYTSKFIEQLFFDMKRLNLKMAYCYPKATDHIDEMASMVLALIEKGHAYEKDGSVYFRIDSFSKYGDFSGLKLDNIKIGARVDSDEYNKEDARDFVLWKKWQLKEDGDIYWDTVVGRGRPGWHIECSAMSMKYLGETIDIHTGGTDLIFPHHQNEIAQSESFSGKTFVKYWLHRELLDIQGDKMSKSAGTGMSLSDIAPNELDAAAFRYLVVVSHYRSHLNFTKNSFLSAKNSVLHLRNVYSKLSNVTDSGDNNFDAEISAAKENFENAMDDDLSVPVAIASVFTLLGKIEDMLAKKAISELSAKAVMNFLENIDTILGINISASSSRSLSVEEKELISQRDKARLNKDWNRSDEIRNLLSKRGIRLEDNSEGTTYFFE